MLKRGLGGIILESVEGSRGIGEDGEAAKSSELGVQRADRLSIRYKLYLLCRFSYRETLKSKN